MTVYVVITIDYGGGWEIQNIHITERGAQEQKEHLSKNSKYCYVGFVEKLLVE